MCAFLRLVPLFGLLLSACGGSQTAATETPAAAASQDQAFDLGQDSVSAELFLPEALLDPPVKVTAKKSSLVAQRKAYASASGNKKVASGESLVGSLWLADRDKNKDEILKILGEIAVPGQGSESAVALHAAAQESFGDRATAVVAYDDLLARFPQSAKIDDYRLRRAWLAVVLHDAATANTLVQAMGEVGAMSPEQHYVVAWARYESGDLPGAAAAISEAAPKWSVPESLPAVRRDLILFHSRAGTPVAEALKVFAAAVQDDGAALAKLMGQLAQTYRDAGQYDRSAEAVSALMEKASPTAKAELHFLLMLLDLKRNRPEQVSANIQAAHSTLIELGAEANASMVNTVARTVFDLAKLYGRVFTVTFDPASGEAAKSLFALHATLTDRPAEEKAEAEKEAKAFQDAGAVPAEARKGQLTAELVKYYIGQRKEQLAACYETALQGKPGLAGQFTVEFQIEQDGRVATAQGGGLEGVASCASSAVRTWVFPTSTVAGKTGVKLTLQAAPKGTTAPEAPAQ